MLDQRITSKGGLGCCIWITWGFSEEEIKTLRETNRANKDLPITNRTNKDLPMIDLFRANGDLLPEVGGDTITFELEYTGAPNLKIGNARLTASLKFARRTDITESQAQPVIDEFVQEVREWIAETFKLEPAA